MGNKLMCNCCLENKAIQPDDFMPTPKGKEKKTLLAGGSNSKERKDSSHSEDANGLQTKESKGEDPGIVKGEIEEEEKEW